MKTSEADQIEAWVSRIELATQQMTEAAERMESAASKNLRAAEGMRQAANHMPTSIRMRP